MRLSTCNSCKLGDHSRHRRVIRAVPKGVMGGTVCGCKGECEEKDKAELARQFLEFVGMRPRRQP